MKRDIIVRCRTATSKGTGAARTEKKEAKEQQTEAGEWTNNNGD
jgi:hypothetical protein